MKLWLYALGMCQSMFCALPFPWHGWEEKARDRMLLCLPLIGLEIGLLWWGCAELVRLLNLPAFLQAFVIAAAPWLLTGFMHLDGFMDVTDAVRSYRSLERRREILKDSHVGSFAVIGFGLIALAQFACAGELNADLRMLIFLPAVSRCGSVIAILCLNPMSTSQYVNRESRHVFVPAMMLVLFCIGAGLLCGRFALALAGSVLGFVLALCRAYRSLQGMNGDISGYSITLSELAGLAALAIISHV